MLRRQADTWRSVPGTCGAPRTCPPVETLRTRALELRWTGGWTSGRPGMLSGCIGGRLPATLARGWTGSLCAGDGYVDGGGSGWVLRTLAPGVLATGSNVVYDRAAAWCWLLLGCRGCWVWYSSELVLPDWPRMAVGRRIASTADGWTAVPRHSSDGTCVPRDEAGDDPGGCSMAGVLLLSCLRCRRRPRSRHRGLACDKRLAAQLFQSTVTSVQSDHLPPSRPVQTVANQVLDLDARSMRLRCGKGIRKTWRRWRTIMRQAEGLSYDVQSLQAQLAALFDLDTAPASTSGSRSAWPRFAGCGRNATAMPCGCKR